MKSALAFAIGRGCPLDRSSFANAWLYVRGGDATGLGIKVDVTNVPAPWSHESLSVIAHRIAVDIRDGRFRADVRHFGDFAIAVEFDVPAKTTAWSQAYGIDPLTRAAAFGVPSPLEPRPNLADEQLFEAYRNAAEVAMTFAHKQMQAAAHESLADRAARAAFEGIPEGTVITEEVAARMANQAAEVVAQHMFRQDARRPAPEVLAELKKPK